MIRFGALWNKVKADTGEEYMTGNLNEARLVILPNKYKKEEKHPDWIIFLAEQKKKE